MVSPKNIADEASKEVQEEAYLDGELSRFDDMDSVLLGELATFYKESITKDTKSVLKDKVTGLFSDNRLEGYNTIPEVWNSNKKVGWPNKERKRVHAPRTHFSAMNPKRVSLNDSEILDYVEEQDDLLYWDEDIGTTVDSAVFTDGEEVARRMKDEFEIMGLDNSIEGARIYLDDDGYNGEEGKYQTRMSLVNSSETVSETYFTQSLYTILNKTDLSAESVANPGKDLEWM